MDDNLHIVLSDLGMTEVQSSKNAEAHRYWSPEAWKGTVGRPVDVWAWSMSVWEVSVDISFIYILFILLGSDVHSFVFCFEIDIHVYTAVGCPLRETYLSISNL